MMYGVGSEIKALLTKIGIPSCGKCTDMEAALNRLGVEWCEKNFQYLINWFTKQAKEHKVSLIRAALRVSIVRPTLTTKIAWLKLRYPFTALSELAVVGMVDHAIERAKAYERTVATATPGRIQQLSSR